MVLPPIFVLTEIIFVKALINVHLKYMNTDFYGRTKFILPLTLKKLIYQMIFYTMIIIS